jgi:hypothetical protein
MRALIAAAGGGLLASIITTLAGRNEPAHWVANLLAPGRRLTGLDLFVSDRYFVFDPVLFVVNAIVFGSALYLVASVWLRLVPPQDRGSAGA